MKTPQHKKHKNKLNFTKHGTKKAKTEISPINVENVEQSSCSSTDFEAEIKNYAKKFLGDDGFKQYEENKAMLDILFNSAEEKKLADLQKFLNYTKDLAAQNSIEIDQT